jgi:5'-nucleotidase
MTKSNLFIRLLISTVLFSWQLISSGYFLAVFAYDSDRQVNHSPKSNLFKLTILHTNDIHAHDEPFLEKGHVVGGFPRIVHLIKTLSKTTPNSVVIDAGDIFQGTPYFSLYHGQIEVEMLNRAHYDIFTIGNHEFDDGAKNLADQLRLAKFDIISANLDASALPELDKLVKASVVKTIGSQKVAFIGAITPSLTNLSLILAPIKLKAQGNDWYLPIANEAKKLKLNGINKIIVVSHCGVELDKEMAQSIEEIDAIIGGHSHTRLNKPVKIKHNDETNCLIVQTGCYGRALGKLTLAFDDNGNLVLPDTRYQLIDVTKNIPEDLDIKNYLSEKAKPFASLRKNIVGIAMANFDNQFMYYPGDSPLGNLICDALAEEGSNYNATIALQNRGGIRGHIEHGFITQEKIQEVLPFHNHIIVATINGKTLRDALEHSVSGMYGGRFLDVHGLKFVYDRKLPAGSRILSIQTLNKDGSFDDLNDQKNYRMAINEFTFKGGEGYDFSSAVDIIDTKKTISQVLSNYLVKQQKVRPIKSGRINSIKTFK